jgi:hypothetical protein
MATRTQSESSERGMLWGGGGDVTRAAECGESWWPKHVPQEARSRRRPLGGPGLTAHSSSINLGSTFSYFSDRRMIAKPLACIKDL